MNSLQRTTILKNVDHRLWREHRFGLSQKRWERLNGKSFWITGAGTGYGKCISIALACSGAKVFLTGRRKRKLEETIEEIKLLGGDTGKCYLLETDITVEEQVKSACRTITNLCDTLHGLVNNAALPMISDFTRPLNDYTMEMWTQIMRTNVTAQWLMTREVFANLALSDEMKILFISSEAGWAFTKGYGPYNISKAALNSLAASLAEEYAASYKDVDIQINTLVPGEARTEMNIASTENPFNIVCMTLVLLSHPENGPNGKFFHADGRHLSFGYSLPYEAALI